MTSLTKTIPAILLAAVLATFASAQEPPKSYTLTVDQAELAVISQALSSRPYGEVAALMAQLSAQIEAQARGQQPEKPDAPKRGAHVH